MNSPWDFIVDMQKYTKEEYRGWLDFVICINGIDYGKFEKFDLNYIEKFLFEPSREFIFEGVMKSGNTIRFIGDESYMLEWWEDTHDITPVIHINLRPRDWTKLCGVIVTPKEEIGWKLLEPRFAIVPNPFYYTGVA